MHDTTWIKLENIMLNDKARHKRINIVLFDLYEVSKIVTFIESRVGWQLPEDEGSGKWGVIHQQA